MLVKGAVEPEQLLLLPFNQGKRLPQLLRVDVKQDVASLLYPGVRRGSRLRDTGLMAQQLKKEGQDRL